MALVASDWTVAANGNVRHIGAAHGFGAVSDEKSGRGVSMTLANIKIKTRNIQ